MKPIRLTKHAREQANERGASEAEIREAITKGSREPAKQGGHCAVIILPSHRTGRASFTRSNRSRLSSKRSRARQMSSPFIRFTFRRRTAMKISYDAEIDALYIRLIEGKHECRTVQLNEEIALNIGEGEQLVGIEILDAKEVFGAGKPPSVVLEGLTAASVIGT